MQEHPERKNDIYKEVLEYYLSNRGLGASLIEIGFPMGRSGFTFEDHLSLWDKLTSDGIFLTAYGDSDTHGKLGFFDRNNFVGYIYADTPCEEEFIHSMKSGNLYTGDPVYLENITISLIGSKNRPMGSVVFTNKSEYAILEITGINEEMSLVWNVNGKNLKPQKVIGNYCGKIEIPSKEKVNYAYATLYLHDRCIMITNPIHTTNDMKIFDSKSYIFLLI